MIGNTAGIRLTGCPQGRRIQRRVGTSFRAGEKYFSSPAKSWMAFDHGH